MRRRPKILPSLRAVWPQLQEVEDVKEVMEEGRSPPAANRTDTTVVRPLHVLYELRANLEVAMMVSTVTTRIQYADSDGGIAGEARLLYLKSTMQKRNVERTMATSPRKPALEA
jgi:hypothetical protein